MYYKNSLIALVSLTEHSHCSLRGHSAHRVLREAKVFAIVLHSCRKDPTRKNIVLKQASVQYQFKKNMFIALHHQIPGARKLI